MFKKQVMKRVFTDMDGTLLTSNGEVSAKNAQLIRNANIPVTLVSARAPMEMKEAVDILGLPGPHVAFNGGLVYQFQHDNIRPLHVKVIFRRQAAQLLTALRTHFPTVSLSYYDLHHWYCDRLDEGIRFEFSVTHQAPTQIFEESNFLSGCDNLFKIMVITFDEQEMIRLQEFVREFGMETIVAHRSGQYHLEFTRADALKSFGIDYICRKEQLQKQEIAAFGDGYNDIPMLKKVGFPIVMANACDEVKAYAKKMTKTNDQDGVGFGMQHYLVAE